MVGLLAGGEERASWSFQWQRRRGLSFFGQQRTDEIKYPGRCLFGLPVLFVIGLWSLGRIPKGRGIGRQSFGGLFPCRKGWLVRLGQLDEFFDVVRFHQRVILIRKIAFDCFLGRLLAMKECRIEERIGRNGKSLGRLQVPTRLAEPLLNVVPLRFIHKALFPR